MTKMSSPESKRPCLADVRSEAGVDLASLNAFSSITVLNTSEKSKSAAVLYTRDEGGSNAQNESADAHKENLNKAVVLFERPAFKEEDFRQAFRDVSDVSLIDSNDKYHRYISPSLKFMVIYPATPAHIVKYSAQPCKMVSETYDDYLRIVLPYAKSIPEGRIAWVLNIVDGKSEQDSVVYRDAVGDDNGFVLVPDSKWDQRTVASLYLLAIAHRRDILCLRSLTEEHLPLLKHIRSSILREVPKKFQVEASDLRLFIHYQPSYYHFHVHVAHVAVDRPGMLVGHSFLLEDVIQNIEIDSAYYQKRTLMYDLSTNHALFAGLNDTGDAFM